MSKEHIYQSCELSSLASFGSTHLHEGVNTTHVVPWQTIDQRFKSFVNESTGKLFVQTGHELIFQSPSNIPSTIQSVKMSEQRTAERLDKKRKKNRERQSKRRAKAASLKKKREVCAPATISSSVGKKGYYLEKERNRYMAVDSSLDPSSSSSSKVPIAPGSPGRKAHFMESLGLTSSTQRTSSSENNYWYMGFAGRTENCALILQNAGVPPSYLGNKLKLPIPKSPNKVQINVRQRPPDLSAPYIIGSPVSVKTIQKHKKEIKKKSAYQPRSAISDGRQPVIVPICCPAQSQGVIDHRDGKNVRHSSHGVSKVTVVKGKVMTKYDTSQSNMYNSGTPFGEIPDHSKSCAASANTVNMVDCSASMNLSSVTNIPVLPSTTAVPNSVRLTATDGSRCSPLLPTPARADYVVFRDAGKDSTCSFVYATFTITMRN